jgi:hypothetical protein
MKNLTCLASFICIFSLSSCSRYYLTCDRQSRNTSYLASSFVGSPDPLSHAPINGEQLVLAWHVPSSFENKAHIELHLTYWDYTQEVLNITVKDRLGRYTLENLGASFEKNKGIIAYKAVMTDPKGKVFQTWEHQLYTKLIDVSDAPKPIKEDSVNIDSDPWDWEDTL